MADLTMTANLIRPLPGAVVRRMTAGDTSYAGEAVYIASDGFVDRADANGSLTAIAYGIVIADNDGGTVFAATNRVDVVVFGPVTGYSSLTPGMPVYVSATAGGMTIAPTDMGVGTYEMVVGMAESASVIFVNPYLPTTLGTAKS